MKPKTKIDKIVKEEMKRKILSEVRRIGNGTFDDADVTPFVLASAEAPLIEDVNDAFYSWWVVYNTILKNRQNIQYDEKSIGSKCNKVNNTFNALRDAIGDVMSTLREVDQEMKQQQQQTQMQQQPQQQTPFKMPDTSANISKMQMQEQKKVKAERLQESNQKIAIKLADKAEKLMRDAKLDPKKQLHGVWVKYAGKEALGSGRRGSIDQHFGVEVRNRKA